MSTLKTRLNPRSDRPAIARLPIFTQPVTGPETPDDARDAEAWLDRNVARARATGKFCEFFLITPAIAKVLLANNNKNRTLIISGVRKWAEALKSGDWEDNGETIKVADTGELNDGQHRLTAVVETGIPLATFVAFGLSRESRKTVDLHSKRLSAHILSMDDVQNPALVAAAAKIHMNLRLGVSLGTYRSEKDIRRELEAYKDILTYRQAADKSARLFHQSCGLFHAIYCIAARIHGTEKADEFFNYLYSPVGLLNRHNACVALNQRLSKNLGAKAKLPMVEVAAITIKAWNAFVKDRSVVTLRWTTKGETPEAFPEVQ